MIKISTSNLSFDANLTNPVLRGTIIKSTTGDCKGSYNKATFCSGNGYIVEGTVLAHRRHTVKATGATDLPLKCVSILAFV